MKHFIQTFRISLLFSTLFALCTCISCQHRDETASVSVVSKNDKVIGVVIRGAGVKEKDLSSRLKIQLIKSGERSPILGEFRLDGGDVIFEPVVPLTRGLKYEILRDGEFFSAIEIPAGDFEAPELLTIYPTQDTLPENLLKMYLHFSKPMVEGRALEYITFLSGNNNDTLKGTFLDVKPELWNAEGTVLTLWLDPGRIKRDLIPNQALGSPLHANKKYTLQISASWPGKNGLLLRNPFIKTFITTQRDEISPQPQRWGINAPASETNDPLEINFQEPLDYFLSKETFRIFTVKKEVSGKIEVTRNEMVVRFIPDDPWQKGKYFLEVESRLEDLAGNNLNRPFDRDMENEDQANDKPLFIREFTIQ